MLESQALVKHMSVGDDECNDTWVGKSKFVSAEPTILTWSLGFEGEITNYVLSTCELHISIEDSEHQARALLRGREMVRVCGGEKQNQKR
jgi:hypothetical protein